MVMNYFKIAWRQLRKQKMYSLIKIGGFALSIAACLLIALYIRHELSYDRFWANGDRIYRVIGHHEEDGVIETGDDWPAPMVKALREDFPEVEKAGRLMNGPLFYGAGNNQVRPKDAEQNTYEEGFSYADQDLLDILQVKMVYGQRERALSEPNTMVIAKSKADKYFPGQNPVGKIMILNNDQSKPYTIGGVMEDFPDNSYLNFDFFLTMTGHELWENEQNNWLSSNYPTFVLLKKDADPAKFQEKLKLILTRYYGPALKGAGFKEAETIEQKVKLLIQPIADVHLYSADVEDRIEKSDIKIVWVFGGIAAFILIIACINFINLSTAKSANRAKEVGLRKVVGSDRAGLVKQFLTESLLFSLFSFILGVLIAALMLPYFNELAGRKLVIPWHAWWLFPLIAGAAVVVGALAGLYPSFYLSSFIPIKVLKGQVNRGSKSGVLRNGLVVFQFATSIILIIGTIIIYKQTHFLLNRKVGFDKDQVLLVHGTNTLDKNIATFKNELLKSSAIKNVSVSDYLPVANTKRDGNPFFRDGRNKEDISVSGQKWMVDHDYINTLGMKIVEGRGFAKDMASDSAAIVINRSMAAKLGLKDPVGQRITNGWERFTVIGVIEDFNYESMRQQVEPLALTLGKYPSTIVAVKISGAEMKEAINFASAAWKSLSPNQPFRYTFLDENFARMYADVQRTGYVVTSLAILAIIIACLGLFALSAFMAEQRTKEIGIRKVLGATVTGITSMLSKDFIRLVLIAILIGAPVAWWTMSKWLEDYAYRISISWWMIVAAGAVAVIIAVFTISFQSIRAALTNPVKSLRSE